MKHNDFKASFLLSISVIFLIYCNNVDCKRNKTFNTTDIIKAVSDKNQLINTINNQELILTTTTIPTNLDDASTKISVKNLIQMFEKKITENKNLNEKCKLKHKSISKPNISDQNSNTSINCIPVDCKQFCAKYYKDKVKHKRQTGGCQCCGCSRYQCGGCSRYQCGCCSRCQYYQPGQYNQFANYQYSNNPSRQSYYPYTNYQPSQSYYQNGFYPSPNYQSYPSYQQAYPQARG